MFITICFNNGVIFLLHCRNKSESVNFLLLWLVIGLANSRKTNRPSVVRVFPRSIPFPYFTLSPLLLIVIFFFVLAALLLFNCIFFLR